MDKCTSVSIGRRERITQSSELPSEAVRAPMPSNSLSPFSASCWVHVRHIWLIEGGGMCGAER